MDVIIERGTIQWLIRPASDRGIAWLLSNYSSATPRVVPARHGPMLERSLLADGLTIELSEDVDSWRDFHDQYSALLIASQRRASGDAARAFRDLVRLRNAVVSSTDPRSARLLALIDREITAAHAAMRTDRRHQKRPWRFGFARRQLPAAWVLRNARRFEDVILRVAVSILLTMDIYQLIASRAS